MSNIQNQNISLYDLHKNLLDLDNISQKVLNEMDKKNKILQKGVDNCKICKIYINNTNKKDVQLPYMY